MTTFARSLSSLARSLPRVRARAAVAAAAGLSVALMFAPAPAGAAVTKVEVVAGEFTTVGLQPRNGTTFGTPGDNPATFANEGGNAVLHGSEEFAIYWDPNDQFHHEWLVKTNGFLQALGQLGDASLGTPFADLGEYRDRGNAVAPFRAVFKGAYSDTAKFPAAGCVDPNALSEGAVTCLTDAQLREQLQAFIATHNLPKGMGTVYFLMTPPGATVCLDPAGSHCSDYALAPLEAAQEKRESVSYKDSFCSYHGDINPDDAPEGDSNTILYAAIPWSAGALGLPGYKPGARVYEAAFDCQDGGFNPQKHEEREKERELSEEEEKALAKDTPEKRAEAEKVRRLEGPHQEEPNQEEKEEEGGASAGLADLAINQIAEEEMNTVSDPLLNAWQDAAGNEVTDLCRNIFGNTAGPTGGEISGTATANLETEAGSLSNVSVGNGRYYINNIFNLAQRGCAGGVGLVARFTAPNPVNAGEIIGVDGMESTVSLIAGKTFAASGPPTPTYATFKWNFGDGTPEVKGFAPGAPTCEAPWLSPCAASAFHSYQYGGTYTVTLTIIDVGGNTTSVSHQITVNGPPAPGSGESGAAASTPAPTSPGTAAHPPVPAPVAEAAVLRQSLRSALRRGLAVGYSVNEQVAGHFEVLLSSAIAHRLGISGTPATGLPAGSPPELVIAKAILVTTKGGHSGVRIQFSKRTAARLARMHRVSLTLRLIVRNAASSNPATTTVISNVTLSG